MLGRRSSRVGLLAAFLFAACGSDDGGGGGGGGPGLGTAGCLTDQQICQFKKGVSTQSDVKNALGNAQEYLGSNAAVYICQQIAGQQVIHNDQVIFDFDSSGHLSGVTVLRQGTGSTPPPNCY